MDDSEEIVVRIDDLVARIRELEAKLAAVVEATEWIPGDEDPAPDVWERADLERFVSRVWGALFDREFARG